MIKRCLAWLHEFRKRSQIPMPPVEPESVFTRLKSQSMYEKIKREVEAGAHEARYSGLPTHAYDSMFEKHLHASIADELRHLTPPEGPIREFIVLINRSPAPFILFECDVIYQECTIPSVSKAVYFILYRIDRSSGDIITEVGSAALLNT